MAIPNDFKLCRAVQYTITAIWLVFGNSWVKTDLMMGIQKKKKLNSNLKLGNVRDRAKRKIWEHKGYKCKIRNIFKNSKFY